MGSGIGENPRRQTLSLELFMKLAVYIRHGNASWSRLLVHGVTVLEEWAAILGLYALCVLYLFASLYNCHS